jgi:hypothetical protein
MYKTPSFKEEIDALFQKKMFFLIFDMFFWDILRFL